LRGKGEKASSSSTNTEAFLPKVSLRKKKEKEVAKRERQQRSKRKKCFGEERYRFLSFLLADPERKEEREGRGGNMKKRPPNTTSCFKEKKKERGKRKDVLWASSVSLSLQCVIARTKEKRGEGKIRSMH